jgi:ribosomal protein S18 acetylase RimI-like enzyme
VVLVAGVSGEIVSIRDAMPEDIPALLRLILEHGPNPWNHLPEEEVRRHVEGLARGDTFAVVAHAGELVVGVVTYEVGRRYPHYQPAGSEGSEHGYLAEAVVHRDYTGRGIGTALLGAAIESVRRRGIREVYAMRHADNVASAQMMEKCGMQVIAEFSDPVIRPSGSQRTAVARILVEGDTPA